MNWKISSARLIKDILTGIGATCIVFAAYCLIFIGVTAVVAVAKAETLEPMSLLAMCSHRANYISYYAYLRDIGVTEDELVTWAKANNKKTKDYTPQQMENAIYNIRRTYARTDLTEREIYYIVFNDCMNPKTRT